MSPKLLETTDYYHNISTSSDTKLKRCKRVAQLEVTSVDLKI